MDVADWLRSLGLGQYEALFRENEIDAEVLPELTEADLEKIAVPLGHRKRLLKAIANLGAAEARAKPTMPPPTASSRDVAERRPITVMFCDLGRLDEPRGEARSRGLAKSGGELPRRRLGRRDFARRPRAEKARRWADGAVRLSAGAGERRRAGRGALAIQRALADINARNAATGARPRGPGAMGHLVRINYS